MNNIIINFGGQDWQTQQLKDRILFNAKNSQTASNVSIINLQFSDLESEISPEKLEILKKIDQNARVYIIDHANPNSTQIASAHYQELADFLGKIIVNDEVKKPSSKLKFSIIACNAGRGEENKLKSFASLFHRYLGQNYKIYSEVIARTEVVMVNSETATKGKATTPLAEYALMLALLEMNIVKNYENFITHQKPGSKVSIQWDEEGNEIILDAYIDKYFLKSINIINLLNEIDIDQFDKAKELSYLIKKTNDLIRKKDNINLENATKVNKYLRKINLIISNSNDEKVKKTIKLINSANDLFIASIGKDSINNFNSKINIQASPRKKEKPIKKEILDELISPVIGWLKALPKTDKEKKLKKSGQKLLQLISDFSFNKMKQEKNISIEMHISKLMENIIIHLLEVDMPYDQKAKAIQEMSKEIEHTILNQIIISPKVTGAIEGFRDARKFGGVTTLKMLIPLISIGAKEKVKEIEELSQQLEAFVQDCMLYITPT